MEPKGSLRHSQCSISCARTIQSVPSHPISQRSILILSNHLSLALPSAFFLFGFSANNIYAFLFPHSCYMPRLFRPPRLALSNYTRRTVQVMKLQIMRFPPPTYHFSSLQSKYSPQHPGLKHPQSLFLP
jgi:hypothetical protein